MKEFMKFKKILAIVNIIIFASSQACYPLPSDPQVVEGDATISVEGSTMNIQASDNTVIDFGSFSINEGESVIVSLPSIDSSILNRVIGPDSSFLAGNLACNGLFILVNPNGIYVASTAMLEAQGLVLSTLDLNNQDFLDNNYLFKKLSEEELSMLLSNEGNINIYDGGFVSLIAGAIENKGNIIAPLGTISLASGEAVKLDISGTGLINVAIDKEQASSVYDSLGNPITDQITNTGTMEANGGVVILDAESLPDIFANAINLDGVVRADQLQEKDGEIRFITNDDILFKGTLEADTGHVDVDAGTGTVEAQGLINTELFTEKGYSFILNGGDLEGGLYTYDNLDGAVSYINGSIGADQSDPGDLIVDGDITLTGTVVFTADSNMDGNGVFSMNGGTSINGQTYSLSINSSANNEAGDPTDSGLRDISGVNNLSLGTILLSPPTFNAYGAISAVNVNLSIGTLTMSANTLTISGTFQQSSGTFNGGSASYSFGALDLNGGTFNSTTGTLSLNGTTDFTGGTFNPNGGTVHFNVNSNYSFTADEAVAETFYNLEFGRTFAVPSPYTLTLQDSFIVGNNVTAYDSSAYTYNVNGANGVDPTPTMTINGDLSLASAGGSNNVTFGNSAPATNFNVDLKGDFSIADANNLMYADITFSNTAAGQNITQTAGTIGYGTWTVDNTGGPAALTTDLTLTNGADVVMTAGAFDCGTHSLTADQYRQDTGTFTGGSSAITFGTMDLNGGTFNSTTNTLTLSGTTDFTGGTFNPNGGTVHFNVNSDYSFTADEAVAETFYNLEFGRTFAVPSPYTLTLQDSFIVGNNVTAYDSTAYLYNVYGANGVDPTPTMTINGDLSLASAGGSNNVTFGNSVPATNFNVDLKGDFSIADANNLMYADITFSNTVADQNITQTAGTIGYGTWTIDNTVRTAALTTDLALTNGADMVMTAGGFDWAGHGIDLDGSGANFTYTNGTISNSTGVFTVDGQYRQDTGTFTGGSSAITFGSLDLNGGTFNSTTNTLTLSGTTDFTGGTFNPNGGTVHFNVNSNYSFTADEAVAQTFYNLEFGRTFAVPSPYTLTLQDSFIVGNNVTAYDSTAYIYNVYGANGVDPTMTINGDLSLASAGGNNNVTFGNSAPATNFNVDLKGDFSIADANNLMYADITFSNTAADQNITQTAGTIDYGDWTINNGNFEVVLNSNLTIGANGSLTIQGGTLYANGNDISLGGGATAMSIPNGGTLKLQGNENLSFTRDTNSGTVEFAGNGVTDSYDILACYGQQYYDLLINSSVGNDVFYLGDGLAIGDNLTIQDGILDVHENDIINFGTFENQDTLRIDGSRATFSSFTNDTNSGTVEYDGVGVNNRLTAGLDYYNLSITGAGGTYYFNAGTTTAIAGALNITGQAGNLITLRSTASPAQWLINPQGATSVSYVDVMDSNNISVPAINALNSVDANPGSCINWNFGTSNLRYWVGALTGFTGLWNVSGNWSLFSGGSGGADVPSVSDDVYFDGANSFVGGCVIDADVNVASLTATNGYTGIGANDGHIDNSINNRSITVTGDLSLDNEQFSLGSGTLTVSGQFIQDSGIFAGGSGSISFGSMDLNGGTFNSTSGLLTLNGTTDFTGGTFVPNGGTVRFNVDSTYSFTAEEAALQTTFYDLEIRRTSGVAAPYTIILQDSFEVGNNLTAYDAPAGSFYYVSAAAGINPTVTVLGDLSLASSGGINDVYFGSTVANTNFSVDLKGDFSMSDADNFMYANMTFSNTAANQNITQTAGTIDYGDWTINNGNFEVVLNSNLTIGANGSLTIQGGTLYANGNDISLGGGANAISIPNGGTLKLQGNETLSFVRDPNSGTVEYAGTGAANTYDISACYGLTYNNLLLNSTAGNDIFQPNGNLTVNGGLTITDGILDVDNNDINLAGVFTNNDTLRIDGSRAAFTAFTNDVTSGLVEYDGVGANNRLTAGLDYFDLSITGAGGTYLFNAGSTYTVAGALNMTGQAGNLITLRSTASPVQWLIDPQGATTVSYVDVMDSNNISVPAINALNSVDANPGSCINWTFGTTQPPDNPQPPEPPEPPEPPPPPGDDTDPGDDDDTPPVIDIDPGDDDDTDTGDDDDYTPPVVAPDEEEEDGSSDGDTYFSIEYGEESSKYVKHYKKGKYRTIVILFEGKIVATPYDKEGPKTDKEEVIVDAGKVLHQDEVK